MKPGDVVLIQSHGARGLLNRVAQALVSGKRTKFTHVLLCVAPGVLIDATPEHGVQLRNVVREVLGGRLTDQMVADGTFGDGDRVIERIVQPPQMSRLRCDH